MAAPLENMLELIKYSHFLLSAEVLLLITVVILSR
jgi:hypothetical protein